MKNMSDRFRFYPGRKNFKREFINLSRDMSARILYFILGVAVIAGVTYAYAWTFDDQKTADSLLTHLEWNDIANFANVFTDVITVDSANDRVGIGTASPGAKLEVLGSSGVTAKILNSASGAGAGLIMGSSGDTQWDIGPGRGVGNPNDFGFNDGTNTRFVLTSTGNVGIGTAAPGGKLDIDIDDANTGFAGSAGQYALRLVNKNTTANNWVLMTFDDADANAPAAAIGAQITDHTNNYGDIGFATRSAATGWSEKMRITSAGNVGIGNTALSNWEATEARALQIGPKTAIASAGNAGSNSVFGNNVYISDAGYNYIGSGKNSAMMLLSNGEIDFRVAPLGTAGNPITFTTALAILPSGNVGIGTTNPTEKLHVKSTTQYPMHLESSAGQCTFSIQATVCGTWFQIGASNGVYLCGYCW